MLEAGLVPTGGFFEMDMPTVVAKKKGVLARHPDDLVTHGESAAEYMLSLRLCRHMAHAPD